jgi:hypothetical protein
MRNKWLLGGAGMSDNHEKIVYPLWKLDHKSAIASGQCDTRRDVDVRLGLPLQRRNPVRLRCFIRPPVALFRSVRRK